jgi:hypothetical protein
MVLPFLIGLLRERELEDAVVDFAVRVVARVREATPAVKPDPSLLSAGQLAKRLGVSVATVRRLDPPHAVVGVSRRYDLDIVKAWLAEREPKATTPITKTKTDDVDVSGAIERAGMRRTA